MLTEAPCPVLDKARLCGNRAKLCLQIQIESKILKGFRFSFFLKKMIWAVTFCVPLHPPSALQAARFSSLVCASSDGSPGGGDQ